MIDRRKMFFALFLGSIIVDQAIKLYILKNFAPGQYGEWPIPHVLETTLTYNKGIAFGMMQGQGILMTPIALIIAGVCSYICLTNPKESKWMVVALALMAGGAIGNLTDRLFRGQVTDMFIFRFINFPVFNFADACITTAGVMFGLAWIAEVFRGAKAEAPAIQDQSQSPS